MSPFAVRKTVCVWGGGHALRGGRQQKAALEKMQVFSLPPMIDIDMDIYVDIHISLTWDAHNVA